MAKPFALAHLWIAHWKDNIYDNFFMSKSTLSYAQTKIFAQLLKHKTEITCFSGPLKK